jgi:hypothetical protein
MSGLGDITGTTVDDSQVASDSSALVWNLATDPDGYLDNMSFIAGSTYTNHAIEFGLSSPLTMTLDGVTFSGYNASDGQVDSALHIKRTSGTVTITCAADPSYKSDGATVVIVTSSVSVTVTCKTTAGANIENVRVIVMASDGDGPFPYQVTVTSITNSGTTATVAHTAHGMESNDKVLIDGASHWQNNGVFAITKIDSGSYSYTMPSDPGSSPTGTIKATFVALEGLTNASGVATASRAYGSNQNVEGWARKSSGSPYYKSASITGTVDTVDGFATTAVMISDE